MGKIKITKQDLKQDEVKTFGMHLVQYVRENYTLIIIVLALVLVGFIGLRLYKYRQSIVLSESNKLFTIALNLYEQGLMVEEDKQRREDFLNESIKTAEQVLRDYPNAKIARHATYLEGNAYFDLDDFDQAITMFQQYTETATDDLDAARGHIALGYCFENKFFFERTDTSIIQQAARSYEEALNLGKESYLAYEAMFCKARLLELQNRKDEAIVLYEKIMNDREFVFKDFEKRVASISEDASTIEQQVIQRMNSALQIFTFYKSAELELTRLRGQKI